MGTMPWERKQKVWADLDAKEAERKALAEQAVNGLPTPTPPLGSQTAPYVPIHSESLTGR